MMKLASPLSRSASASQVSLLPCRRTFVGAGGGVVSDTFVSLTYSIHAFASASFGSHAALSGSPAYFAAGTASVPVGGASHTLSVGIATSGSLAVSGSRALRHASSHGIAR
jgi:hypothetical protein